MTSFPGHRQATVFYLHCLWLCCLLRDSAMLPLFKWFMCLSVLKAPKPKNFILTPTVICMTYIYIDVSLHKCGSPTELNSYLLLKQVYDSLSKHCCLQLFFSLQISVIFFFYNKSPIICIFLPLVLLPNILTFNTSCHNT